MSRATLLTGDCLDRLRTLADGSVRCCVTSPPYWGLRDYGHAGQLGLEATPDAYVTKMVAVFREVRRVLADDGTLWLNLGDSYGSPSAGRNDGNHRADGRPGGMSYKATGTVKHVSDTVLPKQLVGIPWRVAFALQADGWWLRSDIIWAKPNPMPESVTDRPTKAHEYLFLLAKADRYYYDQDAIAEALTPSTIERISQDVTNQRGSDRVPGKTNGQMKTVVKGSGNIHRKTGINAGSPSRGSSIPWEGVKRNARTIWQIPTQPYSGAHFATFPEELARRCIVAGSAAGDTVLDPFSGSGTVASVAIGNGRNAIGIELNPEYQQLAVERIGPMLCEVAA